ncbi:MAG: hypothetical protein GY731_19230 [Gammaproteobacteria bacterium]|nr:hypothetical protein [Gammaproteobacteria bacterium]
MSTEITQMEPAVFAGMIAVFVALAAAGFYGAFRFVRRARIIEDTPTSKIRSAAQGYVEFNGRGELMEGTPIIAPLSSQKCTWYRYKVEERREVHSTQGGRRTEWRTIRHGLSDELFLLVDDTGQCVIDPEGAEVTPAKKETWYGNSPQPTRGPTGQGMKLFSSGKYRYREELMYPGDLLYAIGMFKTVGGAGDLGSSSDEIKSLLATWKKDPARMRQFDTDGDGKIDLQEWEAARKLARQEVLKARADRAAKPGTSVMTKPMDRRRPYLLSVVPQLALVKRYRWFALGSLVLFFLAGGSTVWSLGVRFTG